MRLVFRLSRECRHGKRGILGMSDLLGGAGIAWEVARGSARLRKTSPRSTHPAQPAEREASHEARERTRPMTAIAHLPARLAAALLLCASPAFAQGGVFRGSGGLPPTPPAGGTVNNPNGAGLKAGRDNERDSSPMPGSV